MAICYIYTRESTKPQEAGLQVQAEGCEKYYREKLLTKYPDLGYAGIYQDKAVSGSVQFTEREAGLELNLRAARGDHIVVYKLDRGFRDTLDLLTIERAWQERDITLHVLDFPYLNDDLPPGMRELLLTIMGAIAQFERARIRDRTREVAQWLKRQGRPTNGYAGYGFKWRRKERVPDPEQRRQMAYFAKEYLRGTTLDELYFHCLEHAILNPRTNRPWCRTSIKRAIEAESRLQAEEMQKSESGAGEDSASK